MEFKEEQRLNLWWLYIIISAEMIIAGCLLFIGKHAITLKELRESHFAPLLSILLPFAFLFFINKLKFSYSITENGISYRSIFFWSRVHHISWTNIQKAYIRKYNALSEYGGWGIRVRLWFKLKDKAYIFNDNNRGIQLEISPDKKLLFSTNKPDELELFLINLKTRYNIQAIQSHGGER